MFKLLSYIKKNMIIFIPVTMTLAIIYGYLFNPSPLKLLVTPIIFLMVYPMMVNLKYKELFKNDNTKLHVITQLINFLIIPFIGFGIGKLFFPDNIYLLTGMLMITLLPTSGMTISWTGFAKGNVPASIKMMLLGLILGAILTPLYLEFLVGASINIPFMGIISQIIKIIFIPMLAGFITQKLLINRYGSEVFQKRFKPNFPLISTLGLVGIVFISTSLRAKTIINNPSLLVKIVLALIVLYSINFIISTFISKRFFNREDSIALVYATVMRNLSICLAIAMSLFGSKGSDVALIIAIAFIVQIQGAALYLKFIHKIFAKTKLE